MHTQDLKAERGVTGSSGCRPEGFRAKLHRARTRETRIFSPMLRGASLLAVFFAVLIVALFGVSFSAWGEEKSPETSAMLRVAHLSPDTPGVDVYVDGEPIEALRSVPFKTVSPYLKVPGGNRNVKVFPSGAPEGSKPLLEADMNLDEGSYYTFGIVGLTEDNSLTAKLYEDDNSPPEKGGAKLRVIHAVPDIGSASVGVEGGEDLLTLPGFSNASDYTEVPAGNYVLGLREAGMNDATLRIPGVTLEAGEVYTAFAVGRVADGSFDTILTTDSEGGGTSQPLPKSGGGAAPEISSDEATTSSSGGPPPVGPEQVYVVQPGDTLSQIAERFGSTVGAIAQANGIEDPNLIFAGQMLRVPIGLPAKLPSTGGPPPTNLTQETYLVQPGDTLSQIAERFGSTVGAIAQANGIEDPNLIFAGRTLYVPVGSTPR